MDMHQQDSSQESFDLDRLAAEVGQTPEVQPKKPRRTALIIAGIVGVIVLLGAAAFMGVRLGLLGMLGIRPANGPILSAVGPGGAQAMSVTINIEPAPELPTTPPDLSGTFSRKDGNSLFVHEMGSDGMIVINSDNQSSGPEVEVIVTKETKIYKDTTDVPEPGKIGDEKTLHQKVELVDNLDDIKSSIVLTVWGEKRGDRMIAQIILYTEVLTFAAPAK